MTQEDFEIKIGDLLGPFDGIDGLFMILEISEPCYSCYDYTLKILYPNGKIRNFQATRENLLKCKVIL